MHAAQNPLSSVSALKQVLLYSGLVVFVLIFLKPFGINYATVNLYYFGLLAGYGVLGSVPLLLVDHVLPRYFRLSRQMSLLGGSAALALLTSILVWQYSRFLHVLEPRFHFPAFSYASALFKTIAL